MKLLPADIIITTDKNSWFSKAILAVLRFFQEDPVEYQHSMIAIDDIHCVEALMQVEINITKDRFEDFKRYKILRHKYLTDEQRQEIADKAKDMVGLKYSWIRIGLQLFDQLFNTDYFSRRIKDPEQQICSSLVAFCYDAMAGVRFAGKSWAAIEPDDIDDESLRYNSDFETILEWERD